MVLLVVTAKTNDMMTISISSMTSIMTLSCPMSSPENLIALFRQVGTKLLSTAFCASAFTRSSPCSFASLPKVSAGGSSYFHAYDQ